MSVNILFARCDAAETFGIASEAVRSANGQIAVWDAVAGEDRPSLATTDGVVLFGSSSNVEHADEQPFIKEAADLTREALDRGTPFLGVCFGAQILAWVLDAPVVRAIDREVGFVPIRPDPAAADDPLLSHWRDGDHVFQWHMDTFGLPSGATRLIHGDTIANQAFRIGQATWGVQFHFEIDRAEIDLWLDEFSTTQDLLTSWGKTPDQVRAESDRHLAVHERKGAETFERFTTLAGRAS